METLRSTDLIDVPWKNGSGITREIALDRYGDRTAWRLSHADVTEGGGFSEFSGLVRILTVVSGGGMDLVHPTGKLDAGVLGFTVFTEVVLAGYAAAAS